MYFWKKIAEGVTDAISERLNNDDHQDRWNNPMKDEHERIIPSNKLYVPSHGVSRDPSPKRGRY